MKSKKLAIRVRWILLSVMIGMAFLYGMNRWFLYSKYDRSQPEITFGQEMPKVLVSVKKEELLADVKATDKKDGDVTNTVIIESMSKMLENNQRIVTYAAFDKDNHVGKAERRIQYTDYTPPRFSLTEPLYTKSVYAELDEILEPLHAEDCIDGDLTDKIVVMNTEMIARTTETVEMQYDVQVTNSSGDVAFLKLPVRFLAVESNGSFQKASVELKEYLTYIKVGEQVNLDAFIESVMINATKYGADAVEITTDLDTSKAGVYSVFYNVRQEEASAFAQLIVVVE